MKAEWHSFNSQLIDIDDLDEYAQEQLYEEYYSQFAKDLQEDYIDYVMRSVYET